jgi:hypothetical protein
MYDCVVRLLLPSLALITLLRYAATPMQTLIACVTALLIAY